jgi:hypothetical protein
MASAEGGRWPALSVLGKVTSRALVIVAESGPERCPGFAWTAEADGCALLVVVEADAVVDLGEGAAVGEEVVASDYSGAR